MKLIGRIAWVWIGLLGIFDCVNAQSGEITRLRKSLGNLVRHGDFTHDTAYVDTLDRLAYAFYGVSSDSAFHYGRTALEQGVRTGYLKGQAESWRILGNTYELVGDYGNMLSCYHHSLDIAEQTGNKSQIAKANSNIALFEEQEGEYDQARLLMEKVMDICRTDGDSVLVLSVYSHLSEMAFHRQQYEMALQDARRALQTADAIRDEPQIATCRNDVGRILTAIGESRAAIDLYGQSIRYYRQANDQLGIVTTTALLAQAWLSLKDYPLALRFAQRSLAGARILHRKPDIRESARVLADIYEAEGDDRSALHYFKLYKDFSDSLFNAEAQKRILALAAGHDFEKEESRLREEQVEKDDRYQLALRKDAVKISITILVIGVLSLLAFILLRSRHVNRRINQILREKNEKIEEQKETLEQQAVQLLLNNRQKDRLFSIIAHDLRGPLNSLKTLMDFRKENKLSEGEIRDFMSEFRRNVDYSSDLAGNLLFWASSQLDGIVVAPVTLLLQPMAQDILALFSHSARQKNVLLKEELEPACYAFADKDMVQVILRNLVSNAIKFCRPGDSVTLNGSCSNSEIKICVADTGIGLKAEALEKISRKESFTSYGTAKEKGTGLGMLLCREFTEANQGRFWVESEWGKGCRCYFSLPVAPRLRDGIEI
ncbi:MAG TPA: tetratricopeptide repeat protein [Puia sp.]|nr:tetratricopeptide repeat protein [Puia sp.]